MTRHAFIVRITCITCALFAFASAHQTQTVGQGDTAVSVILGMVSEPAYTDERNGLDLIVQDADEQPVENLENSLEAELISPDGSQTRPLTLRPVYGEAGRYTDDFVLTEPGAYTVRVFGFVGETEVDLSFETHEVAPLAELRFP